MKEILQIELSRYNTFALPCRAAKMILLEEEQDVVLCAKEGLFQEPYFILSGGSNIILGSSYNGIVFHPVFGGVEVLEKNDRHVIVKVKAGVIWDDFVAWSVVNGFGGLENLSLIPGYCGTAPVQNIGAFGTEISSLLVAADGYTLPEGKKISLKAEECRFGYRESIFKHELKNRFIITSTTYKLTTGTHCFRLDYGNLSDTIKGKEPGLSEIRQAVIDIRRAKLPDPQVKGNAGSFFKNPAVTLEKAGELKTRYPGIPLYDFDDERKKVAAGWMIEQCGWKGKIHRGAGVHEKQALVLVNHGNASAGDILELSEMIEESVQKEFGIGLEKEVNFIA
jgi:UDP-N-acetylmuramate dehydrogenase